METNNLTPSEKLKRRIYFKPDVDSNRPSDVINQAPEANTLHNLDDDNLDDIQEGPVVYGDRISDEEFNFSGAAIIYLFTYLALLSIIAIIFCFTYYK